MVYANAAHNINITVSTVLVKAISYSDGTPIMPWRFHTRQKLHLLIAN